MIDNENYGLTVRQGNSFSRILRYRTRASADSPYVSGLAPSDTVKLRIVHASGVFSKNLTFDHTTGEIALALSFTETRGLPAGSAVYEIELQRAPSTQVNILSGPIKVKVGINAD